ncbi:nicotinate-nucleotide--dimethylbenzimidazole phosphoribosyltransferase [Streptomyces sp. NPDC046805]|uniref:nicotinate-nucleotide--dimethylbenzimidazole phosphoribosyltransferase n=1 Tax=Streptomyces sp. NPDC046805 TaxID=3155134 RepID=UPI00340A5D2E
MTDTGQIPGEGLPESAGMVEQPGVAAHGAYTHLSDTPSEDDELLLPGAQGAWGNEVPPPAPEPVVEAMHQPSPHEASGRDSGSVDLSGVRPSETTPPSAMPSPILAAPYDQTAPPTPRRPLHLGPPIPNAAASPVRSLADRGPAGAPVRQQGPPTIGPEYFDTQTPRDIAPQSTAPWVGAPAPAPQVSVQAPTAETVAPQAPAAHLAPDAAVVGGTGTVDMTAQAAVPADGAGHVPQGQGDAQPALGYDGYDAAHGVQGVHGPDGMYGPESGPMGAYPAPVEGPMGAHVTPEQPAEAQFQPQEGPQAMQPLSPEGAQIPEAAQAPDGTASVDVGQVPPEAAQFTTAEAPQAAVIDPHAAVPAPEAEAVPPAPDAVPTEPEAAAPAPGPEAVPQPVDQSAEQPAEQITGQLADQPAEAAAPAQVQGPQSAPAVQVPEQTPAAGVVSDEPTAEDVQQQPTAEAEPHGGEFVAPAPEAPASDADPSASHEQQPAPDATEPQQATPAEAEPAPPEAEPAPPEAEAAAASAAEPVPAEAVPAEPAEPDASAAEPPADQAPGEVPGDQAPLPSTVPLEPHPDQPLGRFVPVEGQVPTTPHLAPTPPQPLVLPTQDQGDGAAQEAPATPPEEPVATVPGPREAEPAVVAEEAGPDVVQQAEDLETRAAEPEEGTAAVAEPRRSLGPAAPAYNDVERAAVLKVIRERRDIRNGFRSDPIPHEVLLRVLEAAHTAPSVGHSQPWDFVVIRSAETRRSMHELAMRQREAYAKSLPKGRAKQFKELKIEAILDTPVNILVTADPTRGGRHTLGRHTQPQMAPYSAALAVENLWLAARAEGLGVGWVSFFDEREMVRALGLPEHLEAIAYLCVGYVDEFPEEPELMQAGWSKRRPLSWVVHEETYGRRALPGEEPHDLLAETVAQIRPLDAKALGEAWERQKRMTKPAGALGMLEIISAQLSGLSRQCPPPIPEPAAVAIFAGDHGVHAQGVTPWPQEVTGQMVANFLGGGAVCNAFASQVGAEVCVVDVGVATDLPATPGLLPRKVRAGTSDMTTGPAMTREEATQAIEVGIETARDLVAAGNKALLTGEMGIANTTASAALISVFTGADPAEVTGRGTGINDETLARKTEIVRRALELHQPDPADPIGVLAAVGGFEHAALVGLLLGGASLRTPVILDGVSAGAAALVARGIAPEVLAACIAGHRSAEPGHVAALNKLGLRPLVDLDLRLGEGTGALLALPMVQSTARAMHEVATFDSAGVTEK